MSDTNELPRDFKGIWISKEIWINKNLSIEEKVLLVEIDSLDGKNGCFASNEYFCKFFNWKERKLQLYLAKLKKLGLIKIESFDGRKRVLKTSHEKFDTSQVSKNTPLTCKKTHLSSIGGFIERENKEENKELEYPPLPPPKEKIEPPTKEEEEELNRRFKKRPKGSPPVASRKKWNEAVLRDIRQEQGACLAAGQRIAERKAFFQPHDGAKINGYTVWVYDDRVELTCGSDFNCIRFDVSEEEWEKEILHQKKTSRAAIAASQWLSDPNSWKCKRIYQSGKEISVIDQNDLSHRISGDLSDDAWDLQISKWKK